MCIIRENETAKSLEDLKSSVLDCSKNIKSNDETFGISTFATVKDKFDGIMTDFKILSRELDASRTAFLNMYDTFNEDEGEEYIDSESVIAEFKKHIDQELKRTAVEPDEEIMVENLQIIKDPITRQNIKFAVKSKVCKHIYDKETILDYFKQRRNKAVKCPQAGCTNKNMKMEELVDDDETNKLIQSL